MRYASTFFFVVMTCVTANAQSSDTTTRATIGMELLPPQKLVRTFTADARSNRLQVLKDLDGKGFVGSLGGQFPVMNIRALQKKLQFSVAATAYTTLNRYVGRGKLINVDFFVDFLFDLELRSNWKLRGGFGHTSQHLTDDALEAGLTARNYVKDYLQLQTVHMLLNNRLMIYGGVYYFHNFKLTDSTTARDLSRKIMIQAGCEADVYHFSPTFAFYVAGDLKLRQEFDFGNTHSLQAGFKVWGPTQRMVRLAYNYLGGYEERGQFYTNKTSLSTVGLYFDF